MAKDNVDVIQGAWDAFARGDVDAATSIMAPDGEVAAPESLPWGGTYTGPEGFRDMMDLLLAHFREFKAVPVKVLGADDDHVVVVASVSGRTSSGKRLRDNLAIWIYQLRDGQVRSAQALTDTVRVRDALD